jgi:hypothetical protein
MKIAIPDATDLVAAPHLAALAALEAALAVASRAVHAALPAVDRGPFGCDPVEIKTARLIIEHSDILLAIIADHRDHLPGPSRRERDRDPAQLDWPF